MDHPKNISSAWFSARNASVSPALYLIRVRTAFVHTDVLVMCALHLVAAPTRTLFDSHKFITIFLRTFASGVLERLSFAPHPTHLWIAIIAWREASLSVKYGD
jgi:hypothetical protein